MKPLFTKHPLVFSMLVLVIVSALAYLPYVAQLGYLNDDWYLMYDAHVAGPGFFKEVFASDRPLRAFMLGPAFSLFGMNPLPYHLTAYAFRLLSGFSALWLTRQLWPNQHGFNFSVALLFLIYPGFLSQVNPIDYQSQLVSLFLAVFSIVITNLALQASHPIQRWGYTVLSIFLGWLYLGLVEYFIGFEFLRVASITFIFLRGNDSIPSKRKLSLALGKLLHFLLIPVGFLGWRLFLFSPERRATDVVSQLGIFFSSPVNTGGWWFTNLLQGTLNTAFFSWSVPLYNLAFALRLRDFLTGLSVALLAAVIAGFVIHQMQRPDREISAKTAINSSLLIGILSIMMGLLPIIIANRYVEFSNYSRYTLPGAFGAAMILTGLLFSLSSVRLRSFFFTALIGVAVLTHNANAVNAVFNQKIIQDFWWQVSWRAPQIKPGTLLTAFHSGYGIQEDYFIWGPANLIYYPEKQTGEQVKIILPAAILNDDNMLKMITGKGREEFERRGNFGVREYNDLLVITQPSSSACVRILDGDAPELSTLDDNRIRLVASNSQVKNIILDGSHSNPIELVFGPQPAHTWCYYYQKASLARQQGDWQTVANLGDLALEAGHYPGDRIEWMPFLQAYAHLDRSANVRQIARILREEPYLVQQACQILQPYDTFGVETRQIIVDHLCP